MADGRLDDLERRIRELEAGVAGLTEESAAVRGSLADLTGDRRLVDGPTGESASDSSAVADGGRGDGGAATEREIVMAPPKGASQAAVDAAVDAVDETRNREDEVVVRGPRS